MPWVGGCGGVLRAGVEGVRVRPGGCLCVRARESERERERERDVPTEPGKERDAILKLQTASRDLCVGARVFASL